MIIMVITGVITWLSSATKEQERNVEWLVGWNGMGRNGTEWKLRNGAASEWNGIRRGTELGTESTNAECRADLKHLSRMGKVKQK